jgi:LPXTG-motif cell wall-anchored protein
VSFPSRIRWLAIIGIILFVGTAATGFVRRKAKG